MTFLSHLIDLFEVFLLLINAIAILNEERFLARIGWSSAQPAQVSYNGYDQSPEESVKSRIVHLIAAVRTLMRIPLIGANVLIIAYELVWGT